MKQAVGIIEIMGLSTGIIVADSMAKAASIQILNIENTKGLGYMTVKIAGDVGGVKAAINVGIQEARLHGRYIGSIVIPRPHDDTQKLLLDGGDQKRVQEKLPKKSAPQPVKEIIHKEEAPENLTEQDSEVSIRAEDKKKQESMGVSADTIGSASQKPPTEKKEADAKEAAQEQVAKISPEKEQTSSGTKPIKKKKG